MSEDILEPKKPGKFKRALNETGTFLGVPANTILSVFAVVLSILTIIPFITIVMNTISYKDPILGEVTGYGFKHWVNTFASSFAQKSFWIPLGNSLVVSIFSCIFAIVFGGLMAFLVTRTNMRFKKFISTVFIFPYVMPQWTLALFWQNFFVSNAYPIGRMGEFQALTGVALPQWMCYGWFPISMVLGLHYAPFAYILIGGLLRNMDSNLEEAATILNIPKWKSFFKVTIPMLKPALLNTILLVFSSAMSSYTVASKLGKPISYNVLATIMENYINGHDEVLSGIGYCIAFIMIIMGLIIMVLNQMSTSGRKSYTTVSGKSGQITYTSLGSAGKWIVGAVASFFVLFFCVGPIVSFAIESLLPNTGDFSGGLTLQWWITQDHSLRSGYNGLLFNEEFWASLWGTIKLSVLVCLASGTCGLLIGYAVAKRKRSKLGIVVNNLAFLPYLLPSISLSLIFASVAATMASMDMPLLYSTPFLLAFIVGTLKFIPFASRSSLNAMMQLSDQIEEAAIIQNVPWWKRMVRIIFPIQKSSFISGYLLPFISCMREYDLFLFIGGNSLLLTKQMFVFSVDGIPALENGGNLMLIILILICNFAVNKITGASLDKGIGG